MSRAHQSAELTEDYPVHKSRPSLTTNASGIAESTMSYGSMTTAEGLQRLSQFPPPPPGVPISPFEASLGLPPSPSSIRDGHGGYMITPPTTPPAGPVRPSVVTATLPAPPRVFSLPPRRQDSTRRQGSVTSGTSIDSSSTTRTARPLPVPQVYSPVIAPSPLRSPINAPGHPLPAPPVASGSTLPLSPHDWHDGSSSIAVDAYEEKMLSTSFITSLLTSVDDGSQPGSPPQYKRDYYEPSISSDLQSLESSVTYPPRRTFPDPNVPASSSRSPLPPHLEVSTSIPTAGRDTPASLHTTESAAGGLVQPSSLSISNSLQSMTSTTPLNQSFPKADPIIEEGSEYASPSTPAPSSRKRERRYSAHSSKTTKSYVSSLITRLSHSTNGDRKSVKSAAHWFRKKPLPPVPRLPDMSLTQEVEFQRAEAALPLPDLVNRAQALSKMLDKGHRPHSHNPPPSHLGSRLALPLDSTPGQLYGDEGAKMSGAAPRPGILGPLPHRRNRSGDFKEGNWDAQDGTLHPARPRPFARTLAMVKQRKWCVGIGILAVIVIIIVVAVNVTIARKHSKHSCPGNFTGSSCTLDATCVCTVTTGGQCGNKLAQNLVNLVPTLNNLFSTDYTPTTLSKAVWLAQGDPGSTCDSQARLVDVAPGLNVNAAPNRTQWAQAAILWNLVESSSTSDAQTLQKFVNAAPWGRLGVADGPTTDTSGSYTTTVSGFSFNFAAQVVNAPTVTFADVGQPSSAQLAQVDSTARSALDRMYTFASASATQQQKALANYWQAVLQQKPSDLNTFLSRIRGSQILLPFDATASPGNQNISRLLTNSTSAPFPPPLACYPGLSSTQQQTINTFESNVFGLSSASPASTFDTSCFPNRPIYGVLDIPRLRLPFVDSRTGLAKQAAVLSTQAQEAASRAVVYNGEVLSTFIGSSSPPNLTATVQNPRRFGTMNRIDHVILDYLQSIPDVNVAIALVGFILSGSANPPTSDSSILFNALSTLPILEVAVFGTINPSDIVATVSSFSDPKGRLFFGTDQSLALRQWSINAVQGGEVRWAELATSAGIVEDDSFTDSNFNSVWNPAFNFFHIPNNAVVGVSNITTGFCATKQLTSCS